MGEGKGLGHVNNLSSALFGAKIDGGTNGSRSHVCCLLHRTEHNLIKFIWVSEQFIVIEFYQERDFVSVLSRDCAEDAEGRGDGIATAFDGQAHDVLRIKIIRIFREARSCGMFDSLIDR